MRFSSESTAKKIEEILTLAFRPTYLEVRDDSHHHIGHRQAGGGGHFFVSIESERFKGVSPLGRQRLVLEAVKDLMDKEIHALSMRCTVVS